MSDEMEVEVEEVLDGKFGPIGVIPDGKTHKEIVQYLLSELEMAESERSGKLEKWAKWRRQREARPEQTVRNKPWPNAANVSVPVAAINGQNMYAYLKKTFGIRDHLITISATTEKTEDIDSAKALEKYLDLISESPFDMDWRSRNRVALYEAATMGTSFVKVPYTQDLWTFKTTDEVGDVKTVEASIHDGPEVVVIPLEDMYYREGVQNVQRSPWFGHKFTLTEHELYNRNAAGVYENVDFLEKAYVTTALDRFEDVKERVGIVEEPSKLWDLYEIYVYWKLPGEDYYLDLLVTFSKEAQILVRAEYNELGVRPIEPLTYMHRPFFLDGMGTGWMSESAQDEVDTIRNMRLDNSHFANMRMLAVKRNSGIKANETVFPGKIFMLDNPKEDIMPIQVSEVYPSSVQNEMMCKQDAQEFVGMPDIARGFADPVLKSGDTFSGQAFRAQKSGGLVDAIAEGLEESMARIAMYTVFQLVRNKDTVIRNERERKRISEEDINHLEKALSMKLEEIPRKLKFTVKTTEMEQTFEARRQNIMTLVQIYSMYLQRIIPLYQMMMSPQMPPPMKEFLMKAFTGSSRLMDEVFKFFGQEDTDRYIPNYKKMEDMLKILEMMRESVGGMNGQQGMGGPQGTAGGGQGSLPPAGMGGVQPPLE
jgi:hypothetical protein